MPILIKTGNRNTNNIEIAIENANLRGKNTRYAQFAEICGNRTKLTRPSSVAHELTNSAGK